MQKASRFSLQRVLDSITASAGVGERAHHAFPPWAPNAPAAQQSDQNDDQQDRQPARTHDAEQRQSGGDAPPAKPSCKRLMRELQQWKQNFARVAVAWRNKRSNARTDANGAALPAATPSLTEGALNALMSDDTTLHRLLAETEQTLDVAGQHDTDDMVLEPANPATGDAAAAAAIPVPPVVPGAAALLAATPAVDPVAVAAVPAAAPAATPAAAAGPAVPDLAPLEPLPTESEAQQLVRLLAKLESQGKDHLSAAELSFARKAVERMAAFTRPSLTDAELVLYAQAAEQLQHTEWMRQAHTDGPRVPIPAQVHHAERAQAP